MVFVFLCVICTELMNEIRECFDIHECDTAYDGSFVGSPPLREGGGDPVRGRPDSSSSASSATDWEGSGHNTVLRRVSSISISAANHPLPPLPPLPPIPANRQPPAPPMVDSLHPLPPLMYNSNAMQFDGAPKVEPEWMSRRPPAPKSQRPQRPPQPLDRLSVRSEKAPPAPRKAVHPLSTLPDEAADDIAPTSLFFKKRAPGAEIPTSQAETRPNDSLQDQIMATQLRRLNRELTPTISDVYHERNLGLGLAPPLTQLLTAHNLQESLSVEADKLGLLSTVCEENFSFSNKSDESTKAKPWLSSAALQRLYHSESGDGAAERESKARSSCSPCSELSRRERDEGDGRSIADSQCSAGSYKPAAHRAPVEPKKASPPPPPPPRRKESGR